jgi:hypothetical protein
MIDLKTGLEQARLSAEAAAIKKEAQFSREWDVISMFIRAHPKTGFFAGIILGILLHRYGLSLIW